MAAFSMNGPFWATTTEMLNETSAAAGIALINSFGNLGGFLGPYTIGLVRTWTGSFRGGLLTVGALLAVSGVLALLAYGVRPAKTHRLDIVTIGVQSAPGSCPGLYLLRPFGSIVYNRLRPCSRGGP